MERAVNFPVSPVTSICRPVSSEEHWALWHFEDHAVKCEACHDPYKVHKLGRQLCKTGHKLAQDVAAYIYQRKDGGHYSTMKENHMEVRVEIPPGYNECDGLFRAIQRAVRHRQTFVSSDPTYMVQPRTKRASVLVHNPGLEVRAPSRPSKPVSPDAVIVEWPKLKRSATVHQTTTTERPKESEQGDHSKRGSLYHNDQAAFRKRREQEERLNYKVELREPRKHLGDTHRRSTYYT